MQIEVGKKYRRRNGIVCVATKLDWEDHQFGNSIAFDVGSSVWESNGQANMYHESDEDIIEEVKDETMKIEVGKYYKARNGHKVHIVEEIKSALDRRHLGIVHRLENPESNMSRTLQYYYADGMVMQTQTSDVDIIEEWKEPKSGVAYINIRKNGDSIWPGDSHTSREFADKQGGVERIACVRVEWKEGQFDD